MARTRLDKTLADYVVIAISPALIMTLVGSLVFFLLEVSYRGQFETRMHWIMFWFVFAAVLVARIAIEEGREHAQFFGFAMCAVAAIAVFRFVDAVLIGWMLLAVVWWCSSKLTWDCTLIDESEDTSGEGLLQAGGFDNATRTEIPERESSGRKSKKDSPTVRSDNVSAQSPAIGAPGQPDNSSSDRLSADSAIETKQPHSPGLWVVYFSLAALPLFGVGQLFIPAQEASRRSYAFQLLAVYVASGIALLLTTSFLGLRRYLRQRKLEMPASMTRSWLGMGTALLASLLLLALIIPRPQGEYTLTAMIDKIDAKARQASQFALLKGDRAEGQGRRIGEQDKNAKQPGEGQPADQKSPQPPEKGQPGGKTPGNAQTGKPSDRDGKSENKSDGKSDGDQKGKSRDQSDRKSDQNGKSDKNGKNDKESGQSDQLQKSEPQQRENQPQRDNEQKRADQNRQVDQVQKPQQPDANKPAPATASTSTRTNWIGWLAPLVKWILYGLLAIVGIYFFIRYWSQFVEILSKLWAEFLSLFGHKPKLADGTLASDVESVTQSKRPFASYENPFFSGAADRMSPPELVRYTFEALEAWSREQAIERPPEQTPLEFAQELGRRVPTLAKDVTQTAQLYTHVAYARKAPLRDRLEVLERLWRRLGV